MAAIRRLKLDNLKENSTYTVYKETNWHIPRFNKKSFTVFDKTWHPVINRILAHRGFADLDNTLSFIRGDNPEYSPFLLKDMDKAIARIHQAVNNNEYILVYGDYDADGVTSCALMIELLCKLGAKCMPFVPHRVQDGYGLNGDRLRELSKQHFSLLITVDCGIKNFPEVILAKELGMDVIITDHHMAGDKLPEALAIIDPSRYDCSYPNKHLCGVGVVFKIAQALCEDPLFIRRSLDLVAIGTIADLVSLRDPENRYLTKTGLEVLNNTDRIGLQQLIAVSGLTPGSINAQDVGFAIAPRLNAAGRMDKAFFAYSLLTATDRSTATRLAETVDYLNGLRQITTAKVRDYAISSLNQDRIVSERLVFFYTDSNEQTTDVQEGILGLIATQLCEHYGYPAVVIIRPENSDICFGSCRSVPGINIVQALSSLKQSVLQQFGGHTMAAGFRVHADKINDLQNGLCRYISLCPVEITQRRQVVKIDIDLNPDLIDNDLMRGLQLLEPTGSGFSPPLFLLKDMRVSQAFIIGKGKDHLKVELRTAGKKTMGGIAFGQAKRASELWSEHKCVERDDNGAVIDIVGTISENTWMGKTTVQVGIRDFETVETTVYAPVVSTKAVRALLGRPSRKRV